MEIIKATRGFNKVEGFAMLAEIRHNIRELLIVDLFALYYYWCLTGVLYPDDIVMRSDTCCFYLRVDCFDCSWVQILEDFYT